MKDRERGDGRIYARPGTANLWCEYWLRGKQFRESTHTADPKAAQRFLKSRLYELGADKIGAQQFIPPSQRKQLVMTLLDALEADFKLRDKYSKPTRSHLKTTREAFGHWPVEAVTRPAVDKYIIAQQEAGTPDSTINRRTQLLAQAFGLGVENGAVLTVPAIRKMSEAGNVRQGFFSERELRELLPLLPDCVRDYCLFGFITGWRAGEIAALRWEEVDDDTIRLRGEDSKNGEPNEIPIEGELAEVMERRRAARRVVTPEGLMLSDLIFHDHGQPLGDYRKAWQTGCCTIGIGRFICRHCEQALPFVNGMSWDAARRCEACGTRDGKYMGRIFHDLRRTAARNMRRAGVDEQRAMEITGHKTPAMFRRYNIQTTEDKRAALRQTQDYLKAQREKRPIVMAKAAAK